MTNAESEDDRVRTADGRHIYKPDADRNKLVMDCPALVGRDDVRIAESPVIRGETMTANCGSTGRCKTVMPFTGCN